MFPSHNLGPETGSPISPTRTATDPDGGLFVTDLTVIRSVLYFLFPQNLFGLPAGNPRGCLKGALVPKLASASLLNSIHPCFEKRLARFPLKQI